MITCRSVLSQVIELVGRTTLYSLAAIITVAMLYKMRWRIELNFRWLKDHLRVKRYYGTSSNAGKHQILISACAYTFLMIAILYKHL